MYLDQLIDLQFFLRDAKQLDTISSTQEAALSTADFGTTIEQVDAQVKMMLKYFCYSIHWGFGDYSGDDHTISIFYM